MGLLEMKRATITGFVQVRSGYYFRLSFEAELHNHSEAAR